MQKSKRKTLGQHFLVNKAIKSLILETASTLLTETKCQTLLEIGPGKGALTEGLMPVAKTNGVDFTLIEKDRDLPKTWPESWHEAATVINDDFLEINPNDWLTKKPIGVVSNLPYSAGTPILIALSKQPKNIEFMILMFQAEVGRRIRADLENSKNRKDIGRLTLQIQNRWTASKLVAVPPESFKPRPKVRSEVIVLRPRKESLIPETLDEQWDKMINLAFGHRRKMLRNVLEPEPFGSALLASGIDPTLRAEALSWPDWISIASHL